MLSTSRWNAEILDVLFRCNFARLHGLNISYLKIIIEDHITAEHASILLLELSLRKLKSSGEEEFMTSVLPHVHASLLQMHELHPLVLDHLPHVVKELRI
jgi:hypothetical protein